MLTKILTSMPSYTALTLALLFVTADCAGQIVLSDSFDRMTGDLGDPGAIPPDIGFSDWGSFDNALGGTAAPQPYLVVDDLVDPNQEITDGQYGVINTGRTILDYNLGADATLLAADGVRISVDINPTDLGDLGFNGRDWAGILLADTNSLEAIGSRFAISATNNVDSRVGMAPRNSGTSLTRRNPENFNGAGMPGSLNEPIFDQTTWDAYVDWFNGGDGTDPGDPVNEFENDLFYSIELVVKKAAGTATLFDDNAEHIMEIYAARQGDTPVRLDPSPLTPELEEVFFWGDNAQTAGSGAGDPTPGVSDAYLVFVGNGTDQLFDNLVISAITSAAVDGDFDNNNLYECNDVDQLVAEIVNVAGGATPNLDFDLTNDGTVDVADLDAWRTEAGAGVAAPALTASGNPVQPGDATLDGTVDGLDFIEWNEDKFTNAAAWCKGDFNADGIVDGLDFIVWNDNKFTSADTLTGVPEPSALLLLLFGSLTASRWRPNLDD